MTFFFQANFNFVLSPLPTLLASPLSLCPSAPRGLCVLTPGVLAFSASLVLISWSLS